MPKSPTLELPLTPELQTALQRLVALAGEAAPEITQEALADYLAWRIPQMLDLEEAIKEADVGQFASNDEVTAVFSRYGA